MTTSSTLFRRVVNVTVGPKTDGASTALTAVESSLGLDVSELDCTFKAKKNLKPEPNTCELKIFNLSQDSRSLLQTSKKLVVRLDAGYVGQVAQLYLGEVLRAQSYRSEADIITEISTNDSKKDLQTGKIALSIGPKVPAQVALTALARAMKVGVGNVPVKAAQLASQGKTFFGPGSALFGYASDALTDICKSADWEWSIQDGVIQILDRGKALEGLAVLLSSDSGLVGSPTIDHKGIVTAKALIQPDLRPGHKVTFDTMNFKASQGYRIQECEYSGDTAGTEWYASLKCKPY